MIIRKSYIAASVILIIFSVVLLLTLTDPFFVLLPLWAVFVFTLFLQCKISVWRAVLFNLSFFCVLLSLLEAYSYFQYDRHEKKEYRGSYNQGYFIRDYVLGYVPYPNISVDSRKLVEDKIVYDVRYTIVDGHRITQKPSEQNGECILFFGGSFTFGEGVGDRQAMPYLVSEMQQTQVYNMAFHGYGPHQMLAAIESGMIPSCVPSLVVFQTIPGHPARSAGHSFWDRFGPRYGLRNGVAMYQGHFDDNDTVVKNIFRLLLRKSYLYRRYIQIRNKVSDRDIGLYAAIIRKSKENLVNMFPQVKFKVLLWDKEKDDERVVKIKEKLRENDISFTLVSEILPDLQEDNVLYQIGPTERHPNGLAHQLIAEYVVEHMVAPVKEKASLSR